MAVSECALARKKLTDAVAQASTTGTEKAVGLVKTGYLTSITSRERHVGGLALSMGLDAVAHYPEAALDYLLHITTGSARNTSMVNPLRALGPTLAAARRGVADAVAAVRAGVDPETVPTGFDLATASKNSGILGTAQRYVATIVSASNKPFFEAAQAASMLKRAQMLVEREGLSGAEAKARIESLLKKPTDEMALGSLADAAHATLSDDNVVAQAVSGTKQALKKQAKQDVHAPVSLKARAQAQAVIEGHRGDAMHERVDALLRDPSLISVGDTPTPSTVASRTGAKVLSSLAYGASELLAPFPKIESNIAGRVLDYSPVGFAKTLAQVVSSAGGKDARAAILSRGLARAGTGTAIGFAAGYYLASKGKISPPDAMGDGQQPLALKLGRDYYDLKTFAPVSLLPVLGASYYYDSQKKPDEVVKNLARATGREAGAGLAHGVLNSVATANDAVHGTSDAVRKLIGNLNPTPSIVRQVAKGTDVARDTKDANPLVAAGKDAMATIPGVRETLPKKLDPFGREQPHAGGLADAILDPSYHTRVPDSPADDLATRLHAVPKGMGQSVKVAGQSMALSPDERTRLTQQFGQRAQVALEQLSKDASFMALDAAKQKEVVLHVLAGQRRAVTDSTKGALYSRLRTR